MTDDWETRVCALCGAVLVWDNLGYKWADALSAAPCPASKGTHKLRGISTMFDELREVEVSLRG